MENSFRRVSGTQYPLSFLVPDATASAAYVTAHGVLVSPEAATRLENAIDELRFSAIQKAVNADPYRPKVYCQAPKSSLSL